MANIKLNLISRGKKGILYLSCRNPNLGRNKHPKQILWSTGSAIRSVAKEKADNFYKTELLGSEGERRIPRKNETSTIKELIECYRSYAPRLSHISTSTITMNESALIMMLSRLFFKEELEKADKLPTPAEKSEARTKIKESVLNMKCDVLKPDLWEKYNKWHYTQRGISDEFAMDANYSINSDAAHILAVVSRYMLPVYDRELNVPRLKDFRTRKTLPQKETEFRRIPDDTEKSMQDAVANKIGTQYQASDGKFYDGSAIFVAFELARFCGMRADEIANCRWDWFRWEEKDQCWLIRVGIQEEAKDGQSWRPKNYRRITARFIPVKSDRVRSWCEALKADYSKVGTLKEFVIMGPMTRREDTIRRGLCEILSPFLSDRIKRTHELRKQYGSDIYLQTKDIVKSARLLGDTVETAIKHYIDSDSSVVLL